MPTKPPRPRPLKQRLTELIPYQFSGNYWRNNKQFLTFLYFILLTNIILFVTRAYYFRNFASLNGTTPNPFYMMSRANGRCLNFKQNQCVFRSCSRRRRTSVNFIKVTPIHSIQQVYLPIKILFLPRSSAAEV